MTTSPVQRLTKRCVIYSRVSSEEQTRGQYTSNEGQEDRCKHAIAIKEDQGWILTKTVRDPGYSGKDMNRPGIQELIRMVKAGEVDVILTYRIDRVSRSIMAFYDFYAILQSHNVEILSLTESFDTSTTVGRLMLNIILSFAQYERELTSERVRHKLTQHANRGNFIGGITAFGYVCPKDSPKGDKVLMVVPREAEVVKRIFKLYAQHQNLEKVCAALGRLGVLSRTRHVTKRDGSKAVIGGTPFYASRLFTILRNPVYKGQISYAQKLYAGKHEAIIPHKIFDMVQLLLDKNARPDIVRGRDEHVHLLKGLLNCGQCRCSLTPYASGKRDPKGEAYLYYSCTKKNHMKKGHVCPIPLLPARALEATIKQFLKAVCKTSDSLTQVLQEESKNSEEILRPLKAKRADIASEHKRIEVALSNFLDAIGQRGIGSTDLRSRYEKSVERRATLDRELELLNAEIASTEHRVLNLELIHQNLRAFDSVIDDLGLEDQKQLFHLFIKNVTVWPHDAKEAADGLLVSVESGEKHHRIYRAVIELRQLPGIDPPKLAKLMRDGVRVGTPAGMREKDARGPLEDTSGTARNRAKPRDPEFVFPSSSWALRDSNPRPHGCDPCALTS